MNDPARASARPVDLVLPAVPQGRSEFGSAQPVLALDLGGTLTRAAVVDRDGQLTGRLAVPTPLEAGAEAVMLTAITTLRATLREGSDAMAGDKGRPSAVAVSAPGPLDPWTGLMIDPPNMGPGFHGMPLGQHIEDALGLPCVVERDTNVAALGEAVFGAATGCRDFLYITVSTGIGGAVVTGGRLMMGPDGVAGELGHIVVDMAGEACGCGARGHLEAIASGTAISRAGSVAGQPPRSAREVARRAKSGDEAARVIMDRAITAFAAACVSYVDIFDPDLIVVGGGVARGLGERWLEPARSLVAATAFARQRDRARIVPAALADDAGLVGCFVLASIRAGDERWRLRDGPA